MQGSALFAQEPSADKQGETVRMELKSAAFSHGSRIPEDYTCDGADVSPPLDWHGVPPAAKSLAIICDDPDAPHPEPWVHWILFNIPPQMGEISKGKPPRGVKEWEQGIKQGKNSFASNNIGYGGACPPPGHGEHRYFFRLYALDVVLTLGSGTTRQQLEAAMAGHIIAEATLMGTYERKKA